MARRLIVPSVIALFFASVLYTTNGCGGTSTSNLHFANITGVVTDAVSRAPIANATITFQQSGVPALTAKTDNEGRYSAAALSPGDVRIDASAAGYQTYTITFTLNEGSNTLNLQLRPN